MPYSRQRPRPRRRARDALDRIRTDLELVDTADRYPSRFVWFGFYRLEGGIIHVVNRREYEGGTCLVVDGDRGRVVGEACGGGC